MSKTIYENPFTKLYLAEQFILETERVLDIGLLSPELFKMPEVISLITGDSNHFLVGVPGTGKTMSLAFLRVECMGYITRKVKIKKEFNQIFQIIPKGLWGIYYGLYLNAELLSPQNFKGFSLSDDVWVDIYSDYVNAAIMQRMLNHLFVSCEDPNHYISKWLGFSKKKDLINKCMVLFANEIGVDKGIRGIKDMKEYFDKRLSVYKKLIHERQTVKIKNSELPGPEFFKSMGYLPIRFIKKMKDEGVLEQNQKVFIIIDEYDQCVYGGRSMFARAINSFVKETVRGPVSDVYVKVGTRPNGFKEKKVLGSDAKIESGRDYKEINLWSILRSNHKSYSELLCDIANRRLRYTTYFSNKGICDIKKMLPELTAIEEAEKYVASKGYRDTHFKSIELFSEKYLNNKNYCDEVIGYIKNITDVVLYQKYMVIIACRVIKRLGKKNEIEVVDGLRKIYAKFDAISVFITNGATAKNNSKIYYLFKDLREPALFLLASEYNMSKYYCGYKAIVLMSEGIPLTFIEICKAVFDEIGKSNDVHGFEYIDIIKQNRAIRKTSYIFRKMVMEKLRYAQDFMFFMDEMGFIFRRIQLDPLASYPTPNSFSIEQDGDWYYCDIELKDECEMSTDKLKIILSEAVDWGYLIPLSHRSKCGSLKTRTKYLFNSVLSPYYDLSIKHLKEPIYLYDIEDLNGLMSSKTVDRRVCRIKLLSRYNYNNKYSVLK